MDYLGSMTKNLKGYEMRKILLTTIVFGSILVAGFDRNGMVVTDSVTGLMWQDDYRDNGGNIKQAKWQSAIDYCEALRLDGYDDWRLPNIRELGTIIDYNQGSIAINPVFQKAIADFYISSSTYTRYESYEWGISFLRGECDLNSKDHEHYIRCVRTGSNAGTSSDNTITHNGITYGTVTSPYTGRVWLDRNLGASRVCTSYDDAQCFGDYYQWGRNADGHEKKDSETTDVQATDVNIVGHGKFITVENVSYGDWAKDADGSGSQRKSNWNRSDASSICPLGFRVPYIPEMKAELLDENSAEIQKNSSQKNGNSDDRRINAYNTFLKLPTAGSRNSGNGEMDHIGYFGAIWANSTTRSTSALIGFEESFARYYAYGRGRAFGFSVRCIKIEGAGNN